LPAWALSARRRRHPQSNNVDYDFWSHFGWYNYVTGSITTDGAVGALVPENILNFNITRTSIGYPYGYPITLSLSASSDSGGTLTWTPGSFIATPTELDFDFGSPVRVHVFAKLLKLPSLP
jgi:hypothetical protein